MKSPNLGFASVLLCGAIFISSGIALSVASGESMVYKKPTLEADGQIVVFPENHPSLANIKSIPVTSSSAQLAMTAPGRVVASRVSNGTDASHSMIFESSDLATVYSDYQQASSSSARATKNAARIKAMFESEAATGRDVTDSENEVSSSRAQLNAAESKLRGIGLDPKELENVTSPTAWLISDVPESQLNEVEKGESVHASFSSFPGMNFQGKADAIGDAIDPVLRTVKVRVKFSNEKGLLRPGMFARIDFGEIHNAALVIPLASVTRTEGKDYVFVEKASGRFERRVVVLLETSSDKDAIVLSGISDNEKVVSKGAILLKGLSFGF
ncbi:MAG: efflux RND transporter periplasmic adaptor subunit [Chitinophagaceae bacterium]|nr:efflux RND transporter periplasmic adaptor subunit [Oligoflexus sp.]